MSVSKSVPTPVSNQSLLMESISRSEEEEDEMQKNPYRKAVGALLFLSVRTRPDISVAMSLLSRHVQSPRPVHWEGIKRVLRYLSGTKDIGR